MRFIDPPLISHAPRIAGGEASVAPADLRHHAPMIDADQGITDATGGGQHDPMIPATDKSPSVEILRQIDWMQLPDLPPAPANTPDESAPVKFEQAPGHPGEEKDDSQTSNRVRRFVQVLQRRHEISSDAAVAITLQRSPPPQAQAGRFAIPWVAPSPPR